VSRAWLSNLLRARQIQEDVARERLAHARLHADDALLQVRVDHQRVLAMLDHHTSDTTLAFIAAASARQSAAATLAAAEQTHAMAEDHVLTQRGSLTAAAQQRLSTEKLLERDEAERRRSAAGKMQQELDEVGSRLHRQRVAST
jgi:hypothetical protein